RALASAVRRRRGQQLSTLRTCSSTLRLRTVPLTEGVDAFSELPWHSPCSDGRVPRTAPLPIAVVMTSFDPGGTERQMIELVRRLDRAQWAVEVACFHTRGAWFERGAEAARVTVFPVTSFSRPSPRAHVWAFAAW